MITLDDTLQEAQDGDVHQPIIDIVSAAFSESIPFDGSSMEISQTDGMHTDTISHSSGAMVTVAGGSTGITLLVTDSARTELSSYSILTHGSECYPAVCELSDGHLGVVFTDSSYDLYYMILGVDGTVITVKTLITAYSTWVSPPSVEVLSDGTYLVAYAYLNTTYSILTRASSDFSTWGSVSVITPSGLDDSFRFDNPDIKCVSSGQVVMTFDHVDSEEDGQELLNCYYITSDDDGDTWSSPSAITSYSVMITVGFDPVVAEKDDGSIVLGFTEQSPLLYMNDSTTGWVGLDEVANMHYNPATGKLIMAQVYTYAGNRYLSAMSVIDVPTWSVDTVYTTTSSPAVTELFSNSQFWYEQDLGGGKYICGAVNDHLMIVDTELDTITYRNMSTNSEYDLEQNVSYDEFTYDFPGFKYTQVDASAGRVYIQAEDSYFYHHRLYIGYFDLTEDPDPDTGDYTYTPLVDASWPAVMVTPRKFMVDPDAGMILVGYDLYNGVSYFKIYSLTSENTLLYSFDSDTDAGFHRNGIYYPVHSNGHVYGGTVYEANYSQGDRYGLMDINLSTCEIVYHRPTWATLNNYNLNSKKVLDDGRILIACPSYGITIFDPATETWVLYNDDNVPGLMSVISDDFCTIDYDPVNGIIFSSTDSSLTASGIVAFPELGTFKKLRYKTGSYASGWTFGVTADLTTTQTDQMPSLAVDGANALWAVWSHISDGTNAIYWDCEVAEKNLTNYLTNDAISVSWEIDTAATLSFTLSHGHLFDPSNSFSVLAPFLIKGRRIELQMGEKVSGTDYLQPLGTFVITETSIKYKRGEYPVFNVSCEDLRSVWEDGNVVATEYFSNISPMSVITSLAEDHGGLENADINLPTISGSHNLYHQFLDQDITEMITDVLGHFGYFLHFDTDGKLSAKRIDLSKSVDSTYSDEIIDYTPDDSFSSFVNRVVVAGEGRDYLEVLYETESINTLSGTVLPFGGTKTERVWFSDDHSRKCRSAYLDVNTSIREFSIFLIKGGGHEYISTVDDNEQYVDITIEAPDLTGVFIALAAAIVATGTAAIECTTACGPFIFALSIETQLLGYALGAIAQYDYEIYASPVGSEKQTFQAESNDYVLQQQLNGQVITEEIDDSFCYNIQSCQNVAGRELDVVKAQRNRVSFSKPAHLQDEIGDKIRVAHPYTGADIDIFVTALTRTWQKGVGVEDKIEGWRV